MVCTSFLFAMTALRLYLRTGPFILFEKEHKRRQYHAFYQFSGGRPIDRGPHRGN